jgi:uncharacterized protein involved in exopolysaccharide biosynthesis
MPDPSGHRHLIDYVKVLYKRRRLVASAFIVVFASTVAYTYTRVPIYEARVKILIDAGDTSFVDFREVVDPRRSGGDYYQTQYDLLRSRALAAKTLTALNLWESFGGSTAAPAPAGEPPGVRGMLHKMRGWFGGGAQPAVAGNEVFEQDVRETRQQSRAINRLLSGLSVAPVRNSRIVDLKYRSSDRSLVDKVANAHARSYIEQNMEFKFMSSKEATDWLATQLGEQRKHVQQAESALQQYREKTEVVAADAGDNIVIQKLADLSREVTRAKTQRLEREAVYRQMQAMQGNPEAIDSFPAILSNPVIQGQQAEVARLQRQKHHRERLLGQPWRSRGPLHRARQRKRMPADPLRRVRAARTDPQGAVVLAVRLRHHQEVPDGWNPQRRSAP